MTEAGTRIFSRLNNESDRVSYIYMYGGARNIRSGSFLVSTSRSKHPLTKDGHILFLLKTAKKMSRFGQIGLRRRRQ